MCNHFPTIASIIVDEDYHERKPHACHWKSRKALQMTTYHKSLDQLMPDFVCWIPYDSSIVRHQPERIVQYFGYVQTIPPLLAAPSLSIEEIDHRISHPFMSPTQLGDPPRHPHVVHHDTFIVPDPPQELIHAAAMIIIARTDAYTLTEHCLRLARGVTEQRNVYVQSRCKRDTHDTLG
ncbi:hypothetical protein HKD37_04G009826 [Glycine soja]